jgi:hypothetical protein
MAKHLAIDSEPRIWRLAASPVPKNEGLVSTSRAMEILERIAERRDQWASNPIPLAERIRVLP